VVTEPNGEVVTKSCYDFMPHPHVNCCPTDDGTFLECCPNSPAPTNAPTPPTAAPTKSPTQDAKCSSDAVCSAGVASNIFPDSFNCCPADNGEYFACCTNNPNPPPPPPATIPDDPFTTAGCGYCCFSTDSDGDPRCASCNCNF
jgi:hypothetical protein